MLGVRNATIEDQWAGIPSQAELPTSPEKFFAHSGPMPVKKGCLRAFERHYLRCKAILQRECEKYAIYLEDCSRTGMGFVSPVQLFPCERVQLWMDDQRSYQLEITRCQKIGPSCYKCGTVFILKS